MRWQDTRHRDDDGRDDRDRDTRDRHDERGSLDPRDVFMRDLGLPRVALERDDSLPASAEGQDNVVLVSKRARGKGVVVVQFEAFIPESA